MLLNAVREGAVIAMLVDQDVDLDNVFIPFFGLPAAYPEAPIRLALKFSLPIFSSFIVRKRRLTHHIITQKIDFDAKSDDVIQNILTVYNKRLENLIFHYPDQWIWWHKRWRRRPNIDYKKEPSRLMSTKQYLKWLEEQIASDA
jgi:KDO2-lipid IV(A) lauroyltransferase